MPGRLLRLRWSDRRRRPLEADEPNLGRPRPAREQVAGVPSSVGRRHEGGGRRRLAAVPGDRNVVMTAAAATVTAAAAPACPPLPEPELRGRAPAPGPLPVELPHVALEAELVGPPRVLDAVEARALERAQQRGRGGVAVVVVVVAAAVFSLLPAAARFAVFILVEGRRDGRDGALKGAPSAVREGHGPLLLSFERRRR